MHSIKQKSYNLLPKLGKIPKNVNRNGKVQKNVNKSWKMQKMTVVIPYKKK